MSLKVKENLLIVLVSILQTYVFYYVLYPEFYLNGDNEFYNKAYNHVSGLEFYEGYKIFGEVGGSGSEPISYLIMAIFSKLLPYDVYFYISNILFITIFGFFLRSAYLKWFLPYFILSFSFYVFIGSGLTQRLAIALALWIICMRSDTRIWVRLLPIFSHWQMLIIFIAQEFGVAVRAFSKCRVKKNHLLLVIFGSIFLYFLFGGVSHKVIYMSESGFGYNALLILLWPLLLLGIGYRLSLEDASLFFFVFIVAIFISSGRLNILCFFYCVYLLKGKDKKLFYFSLILTPYFVYKHHLYYLNSYQPGKFFGLD